MFLTLLIKEFETNASAGKIRQVDKICNTLDMKLSIVARILLLLLHSKNPSDFFYDRSIVYLF